MECLLEITFQRSQHKIEFGRVSGSILGGFGLHFGRFFGVKSEKVASQSGLKSKPKNKAKKGPGWGSINQGGMTPHDPP